MLAYTCTSVTNIISCWQDEFKNRMYMKIIEEMCNKYGAKEFIDTELKDYVFRMEYLLMRYIHGLTLIYFCIKNNFVLKVNLQMLLCV